MPLSPFSCNFRPTEKDRLFSQCPRTGHSEVRSGRVKVDVENIPWKFERSDSR
jgi:hypothetical protein